MTVLSLASSEGFDKVSEALKNYASQHGHNSIFDEYIRSMFYETDLEFRGYVLIFVNAVLSQLDKLEDRIEARSHLQEMGFDIFLQEMKTNAGQIVIERKDLLSPNNNTSPALKRMGSNLSADGDEDVMFLNTNCVFFLCLL